MKFKIGDKVRIINIPHKYTQNEAFLEDYGISSPDEMIGVTATIYARGGGFGTEEAFSLRADDPRWNIFERSSMNYFYPESCLGPAKITIDSRGNII